MHDDIGSGAVRGRDVTGGNEIAFNSIAADDIADNAVGSGEIAGNAVNTGEIIDGEVKNSDIGSSAVNSSQIANGEVMSDDIHTDAVNSTNIDNNTIQSADIAPNIIPTVMNENTSTMSTSSSSYRPKEVSWNTSIYLPPRYTDYNLSVYWTGNDTWVSTKETELLVRFQLKCHYGTVTSGDNTIGGPNEYKIADDSNSNLTTSCVFYSPVSQGTTAIISIQIRSNNNNLVGVNEQNLFAVAYPSPEISSA